MAYVPCVNCETLQMTPGTWIALGAIVAIGAVLVYLIWRFG